MEKVRKRLSELSAVQTREVTLFLESHYCTVFHEPDFNRIVSEVFMTDFMYELIYSRTGQLLALCPLHTIRNGILASTYSNPAMYDVRYGGWVYDRTRISLPELMNQLMPSWNESLTYWSTPQIKWNDYTHIDNMQEFQTGVIDLQQSVDDILHKCISRKRREAINSAIRKGVVVEKLDLNNLEIFIEQCNFIKTSIGGTGFPRKYFVDLYHSYSAKKKIVVFASRLGDKYLATGMIVGNNTMTHLWVAGKPRDLPAGIPRQDLLIWEAIKWSKEIGSEFFDLCVIEAAKLPNIAKHKLGFSKKIVPFYLYAKKRPTYRIASKLGRIFR